MKRLTIFLLFGAMILFTAPTQAQDVNAKLNEAESAYNGKNLDDARFALQGALNEINMLIGQDILKMLPQKMSDMACNAKEDNVSGAAGFAGLSIIRTYGTEARTARIDILGDSPMLASLNALLAMPMIMGSDPNQKRIKVGDYKGLLQKETSENVVTGYTVQLPVNSTLVTFKVEGSFSENEVMSMAQTIPVAQIAKISQ
jgi:hypothetical protein